MFSFILIVLYTLLDVFLSVHSVRYLCFTCYTQLVTVYNLAVIAPSSVLCTPIIPRIVTLVWSVKQATRL